MTRPDEALMDRGGMASSALRVVIRVVMRPTNLFALALAFLFVSAAPGTAQTVVGGVQPPSVTVDQSVLDSLGPPRTLPDLLRGAPPEGPATEPTYRRERSAEHQTKTTKKKKVVAKAKPKHKPPTVAARKAAPVKPVAATAPTVPRESVAATPLAEPKAPSPPAAAAAPTATAAAVPNASTAAAPSDSAAATPSATAAPAPSVTAAIPPATPAPTPTAAASPSADSAPPTPPPSEAKAAPAAAKPATPTVAPPSPVPSASPSPTAETAMAASPSVPPAPPVAATPVAAPAAVAAAAPGGPTRVLFAAGAADLPDSAKPALDALVQRLSSNDEVRLQLVAHASGSDDQANEARRISLQRALAVRSYLIEHGIASTRMDVRALGNRSDGGTSDPLDRVDVITLEH
jgi:outer membrane protein OmpA-like peptidoglycan-associated protein